MIPSDEKRALMRHLRQHHPNLLGGSLSWPDLRRALEEDRPIGFATGSLPDSGLSEVPFPILDAVHRAAHMGLYFDHQEDDWLCREHEAQKAIAVGGLSDQQMTEIAAEALDPSEANAR